MKNLVLVLSLFVSASAFSQSYSSGDMIFGSKESPNYVIPTSDPCYEVIKDLMHSEDVASSKQDLLDALNECESDGTDYLIGLLEGCDCEYGPMTYMDYVIRVIADANAGPFAIFCCKVDGVHCYIQFPETCQAVCNCQ